MRGMILQSSRSTLEYRFLGWFKAVELRKAIKATINDHVIFSLLLSRLVFSISISYMDIHT